MRKNHSREHVEAKKLQQTELLNTPSSSFDLVSMPGNFRPHELTISILREKMRAAFDREKARNNTTLLDVGIRMGMKPSSAAQFVNKLLKHINEPSIFTVEKFARAVGLSLSQLLEIRNKDTIEQ